MINKPELLAPGGSFSSAIYSFRYGADAVYIGLKDLSARKSAENFSLTDLARLKKHAADKNKKIYVTLNTVIKEDELSKIFEILNFLSIMSVDGIIVQDFGLIDILKESYPGMDIHASTQMAVHNNPGVSFLEKEGLSRIILARELVAAEISAIKKAHPKTELEVFIHGALCYSFSGLCLASSRLTGRSANRGECSQICRTWFSARSNGEEKRGYFFSMMDLGAHKQIEVLAKAGVSSLKIEGRMKTPEYSGYTAGMYRSILENNSEAASEYTKNSLLTFSRKQNDNWLAGNLKSLVVDTRYPSHRGIPAGKVINTQRGCFTFKTEIEISVRDGLMFFEGREILTTVKFSVKRMADESGKNITSTEKGQTIKIFTPNYPEEGQTIYKISSHDLRLPLVKTAGFPIWKKALNITVILKNETITIESDTGISKVTITKKISLEKARNPVNFVKILTPLLEASDKSFFSMEKLIFKNESSLKNDEIFIPPSMLKKIKNDFYKLTDESIYIKNSCHEKNAGIISKNQNIKRPVFPREKLSPKTNRPIPFALFDNVPELSDFSCINGEFYIPLMPVLFNPESYFNKLETFIASCQDKNLVLGLNNPAHLEWAKELGRYKNVSFFVDYGLYIANSKTYKFMVKRIKDLKFVYFWIEGSETDFINLVENLGSDELDRVPVFHTGNKFSPHLFLSRSCYTNMLGGGKCPGSCNKNFTYSLSQGKNNFTVVVKNCLTWLV